MSITINGQQLSPGWDAEIKDREGNLLTDVEEVIGVVIEWLGLGDRATEADWSQLVEQSDDPDFWLIPLDIEKLGELVCNDRYLNEAVQVGDKAYSVLIDLSDY